MSRSAAEALKAGLLLRLGEAGSAGDLLSNLASRAEQFIPNEAFADAADAFASFGSPLTAMALLDRVGDRSTQTIADRRLLAIARARMALRMGQVEVAQDALMDFPEGLPTVVGANTALELTKAHIAHVAGDPESTAMLERAIKLARNSGAQGMRRVGELLLASKAGGDTLSSAIVVTATTADWHLSYLAEDLIPALPGLTSEAREAVSAAALRHPDRWRHAIRHVLDTPLSSPNLYAARILEAIGTRSDIPRLRHFARSTSKKMDSADVGRALSRRLADHVEIEDQGRVEIVIGTRTVSGTSIRRKVLALMCFLITRPEMSATRDQVLDALWPETDPEVAVNSLNQTLYFLRRVLEESYSDDLSPGYVHHDSDVVWLDRELVTSRSVRCRNLIREMSNPSSPDEVETLSLSYRGRFALDFEYEEWAAGYRDSLHAAYLEIIERSVLDDFRSGHYDRGIRVARRALEVDASAEQVEVSLLRLYRVTGAHAAAAEQYAHYATVMREEYGIEPPPLDTL